MIKSRSVIVFPGLASRGDLDLVHVPSPSAGERGSPWLMAQWVRKHVVHPPLETAEPAGKPFPDALASLNDYRKKPRKPLEELLPRDEVDRSGNTCTQQNRRPGRCENCCDLPISSADFHRMSGEQELADVLDVNPTSCSFEASSHLRCASDDAKYACRHALPLVPPVILRRKPTRLRQGSP